MNLKYFKLLKEKVAATFRESYEASQDIRDWKGQEIADFQKDLSERVQGRISEKWFYTHLKTDGEKLPRIDMLNLLSAYAGFEDWGDFRNKVSIDDRSSGESKRPDRMVYVAGISIMAVIFLFFSLKGFGEGERYKFCFIDADRRMPITDPIEILILNESESPIRQMCDNSGCFVLNTSADKVRFIVKSPYFKTDTITRFIKNGGTENIALKTNDYALMIHIFSSSKISDWEKRRQQLDEMIHDNARIYQIDNRENLGMELYNKQEFINKMTMPVNSLKNIEILETIYKNGKIYKMRFRQQSSK